LIVLPGWMDGNESAWLNVTPRHSISSEDNVNCCCSGGWLCYNAIQYPYINTPLS